MQSEDVNQFKEHEGRWARDQYFAPECASKMRLDEILKQDFKLGVKIRNLLVSGMSQGQQ